MNKRKHSFNMYLSQYHATKLDKWAKKHKLTRSVTVALAIDYFIYHEELKC
jgi:hypothetical protein